MAKKTNGLKIVGIALLAIVGFGSLSALARNKDKDEDKHVHDFSETNICADCGERQEEILFSDVKVGMDLTGYTITTTLSDDEVKNVLLSLESSSFVVEFENSDLYGDGDESPMICFNTAELAIYYPKVMGEPGEEFVAIWASKFYGMMQDPGGAFFTKGDEEFAIHKCFGKVSNITIEGDFNDVLSKFKLVYVGYEGTQKYEIQFPEMAEKASVSFSLGRTPSPENSGKVQEVEFEALPASDSEEWTRLF